MNIAITGHRPERVAPFEPVVRRALLVAYEDLSAYRVIQGCAAGVDMWAAQEAFLADIPYVCARPWAGHTPRKIDREAYKVMIKNADEVVNVNESEDYLGPWMYHDRNEWMVDRADYVVAVWDGSDKGGTAAAVKYALKVDKPLYIIRPEDGKVTIVD